MKKTMNFKLKIYIGALILVGLTCQLAQAQQTVTGNVVDATDGTGLPGVTVLVKGTTNGTVTDIDGNYTIKVEPESILIYSFLGYLPQEVAVGSASQLDVRMELDVKSLDEVVIVGYGEQKKANLTGAITVVETQELENIPAGNLTQALIGKLAGVQVQRNGTGVPGTRNQLVIRDESASGMERQVLYVIDGVIYSAEQDGTGPAGDEVFNRLDPSEIESISILKDAAAAVYGARGAGGVVLVKTKRGKSGQIRVNYNGSLGIGQPTKVPEMLTSAQHVQMLNDILDVRKTIPGERVRSSDYYSEEEILELGSRDYNWMDGLYKDAYSQRHSVNVSGGSEKVRYFFAGNYYSETGNFDDLWFKRYGFRSNIETDLSSNILLTVGLSYSEGRKRNPDFKQFSDDGVGQLREFYKRPLTAPRWTPPVVDGLPVHIDGSWNPYGFLESQNYALNTSNNTNVVGRLDYKFPFIEGLKLSGQISYNINTTNSNTFRQNYETYALERVTAGSRAEAVAIDYSRDPFAQINEEGTSEGFGKGINYQANLSLNYSKSIGKHAFSAMLVYEQSDGDSKEITVNKRGADIKGFNYLWAFDNASTTVSSSYKQLGRWGLVGRLNYDYAGKYLIETSFRGEASSKFAGAERWGVFPAVSAGWVMSGENFFADNVSFIDFLKLRASYGIVGNDNTRPYEHRASYLAGGTGPVFGTGDGSLSNAILVRNFGFIVPTRTWASVHTSNIGIDLRALDDRLSFTTEYYYAETRDGFVRNNIYPFELGNEKPPFENYKISYSRGFEFQLGFKDKIGKDFTYSLNANLSRRESRPLRLYQNPAVVGTFIDELLNDDSNQPGYIALGIIRDEEHLEEVKLMYPGNLDENGDVIIDETILAPGMLYFADVGGPGYSREPDGRFDGNDKAIIAEYTTPPFSYGLTISLSWKQLGVSGSFGGAFGHKVFFDKDEQDTPNSTTNVLAWWADYWTPENTDAKYPRPHAFGLQNEVSTFWMRDGHTLRLNDVSMSYTVPKKLTDKLRVHDWRFYVTVTNAWTLISPFDWKDPIVSEAYDYPLVRMISFGTRFSL